MAVLKSEYLEFSEGSSDEFYRVEVIEAGSVLSTVVTYGKRGAAKPGQAIKYAGEDKTAALAAFTKAVGEKLAKGYQSATDPQA